MENKQTAVEWLLNELIFKQEYEHLPNNYFLMSDKDIDNIIEKAKEMERQQMFECWETAHQAGRFEGKGIAIENWQTFKEYNNETFKSEHNG